ncbi:helix-turn-helix domain-containing protein [uncultured Bacteroides sp.]|uniref:helix-turn-helix domain-containing protein n=1 Tax=uncultured Bacteroides sp. TaxID=162156 RepID=UPI0025D02B77|nr:helix-turn-helix domain-containing protein [uncultured Bacteroides sp.]
MIKKEALPKFDLPVDFVADDNITGDILHQYSRFPCKIKAGIFILCTEGTLKATVNLLEVVIKKNDFIVLLPNSFIQIHEVSSDTSLCVAVFSSEFMASGNYVQTLLESMPTILNNPVVSLDDEIAGFYRSLYPLLIRAYTFPYTLENKEILRSVLAIFLQGAKDLYKRHRGVIDEPGKRENELHRQFVQLLMTYYNQEHEVSFYAKRCGVTPSHFSNAIRKASGHSPLAMITEVLVMNAKTQLKSSRLPVKEIAFSLGFDNLSFFNKYFRKHVGMTPQEYREK